MLRHNQTDDGTEKLLVKLADGEQIECVLLRDGPRRTICISTQVGCAMGCVFCASGLDGVVRNLSAGEIVEQMLRLDRLLPSDERLSHVVVMGMGEPLANVDALLAALAEATDAGGLGISARRITISTVGLPKALDRLAGEGCRYNLAVSLHAPDDELRNRLVPVNRGTGLGEIIASADRYFESSGRRLTFEYVLLAELNDQPTHARKLAALTARADRLAQRDPLQSGGRSALRHALGKSRGAVCRDPARFGSERADSRAQGRQDQCRLRPTAAPATSTRHTAGPLTIPRRSSFPSP